MRLFLVHHAGTAPQGLIVIQLRPLGLMDRSSDDGEEIIEAVGAAHCLQSEKIVKDELF